ncbi:MAG: hypothetical protein KAW88_07015 [Candidatus Cloacimonetes bacterium]|nr:hypothetical protein [Candidatus Cloacimonadota bacterium]
MNKLYSELDVLFDVVEKLNELHIDYMLTGSLAMNYYAEPRMTRDIDIIIEIFPKDINRFIDKFQKEYYIAENSVKEAIEQVSSFNIIHNLLVIKLDFIIRKKEEYRKMEFDRKQTIRILDNQINIVSKEDLIISKLYWAKDSKSEKQKNDIINLLQTGYNKEYLIEWLITLNLIQFFKDFIDEKYIN